MKSLVLKHVGPAAEMEMKDIAPRINLITGDNGLGKTFLLDAAWWAITDSWAAQPFEPEESQRDLATIRFETTYREAGPTLTQVGFDRKSMTWSRPRASQPFKGLALFARADGSFAVWDYLRTPWRKLGSMSLQEKLREAERAGWGDVSALKDSLDPLIGAMAEDWGPASRRATLVLTADEVLKGVEGLVGMESTEKVKCAGLISDLVLWEARKSDAWKRFVKALAALSPSPSWKYRPGKPMFLNSFGEKEVPTVIAESGRPEPILLASSAIRRVVSFAYLVVWALEWHERKSKDFGMEPTADFLLVFDELEAHLHPAWQRTILGSVVTLIRELAGKRARLQLIATTHSPLVLASAEPLFDPTKDALWKLDLEDGQVKLERDNWHKRGDASRWLRSDVFDLATAGSLEAEKVMEKAQLVLATKPIDRKQADEVAAELAKVLPEFDPFLIRWNHFVTKALSEEQR